MAYTLRSLATDKVVKKVDGFRARLADISVVDGFNVRHDDDELREHVAGIAGAIAAGLPIPPIEVWVNPETGTLELVDGHCRYAGYSLYAQSAADFDGWVSVSKFEGSRAQRKARIVTSNTQLKLKPVELGRVYLALRDGESMSRHDIAKEVGRSLAHVDQMLLLASAKKEVIAAVESGQISATEAVKLARDFGDQAPAELERRVEVAKESGKVKVTASAAVGADLGPGETAGKPNKKSAPSRPKIDFVVSCAVVLANSVSRDSHAVDSLGSAGRNIMVPVDADLLADLLAAVRDLQGEPKPLDVDKWLGAENQLDAQGAE